MSATSRARRSDSLYHETDSGITRRWLCDKVALLEDELHESQEELYGLHCMIAKSETENAKLQELIADVWNDVVTRMNTAERHAFIGKFVDRMRELGVEVD